MAVELYATNRFPGDGTTTQYEINFSGGYMDKSHVKAYIEDAGTLAREDFVITSAMFVGPYTINVGVTTPVGKTFVIYRDTPKGEPLVDFVNGSRITEQNLDKVARQAVLGLAEVYDASNAAVVAEFTAAAQNVVDAKDDAIAAGAGAQAAQAAAEAAQAAATAAKDDAQDIADSINPAQFALATELATLESDTATALNGKLSNADGAVTLSKLADGILEATTAGLAKMADGFLAATTAGRAKMSDLFVTTAKLDNNAVTLAKLAREGTAGQVLVSGGAGDDPAYASVSSVAASGAQIFTASGTFTIPANVANLKVTVIGGGGGGGGATGNSSTGGVGGNGGGGGAAISYLTGLTPGNTLAVTVGAAGSTGSTSAGGTGGTSSVASGTQSITTITCTGGAGGPRGNLNLGSAFPAETAGGSASGGQINMAGTVGERQGFTGITHFGGGNGVFYGAGVNRYSSGSVGAGGSATAYGNGGGGGYINTTGNYAGGAGGAGVVIFEW